jgi:catechol 2,3-dioxygenase-like lactoylglutathione lyase family enzyme
MIDHLSIGVADLGKAKAFYDAALAPLGYTCLAEDRASLGYGPERAVLWVLASERPVPADAGSGLHICISAPDRRSVAQFHAAALRHGGTDNGGPGLRADYGADYYAAFVIDPAGYRLEAYCGSSA